MKYLQNILLITIFSTILASCIHENDCPEGSAILKVADKNFSNVQDIEQAVPISEDLPMRSYVNSLDLLWQNTDNATDGQEPVVLNAGEKAPVLDLSGFKKGSYNFFIASGNTVAEGTVDMNTDKIELHPDNAEHKDLYSGNASFSVPLTTTEVIYMYRLKGKLLIVFDNLPAEITDIDVTAENVSKTATKELTYEGTTSVNKSFVKSAAGIGEFLLAPSAASGLTKLTIVLKNGTTTVATISNATVQMERNKLTVIKPTYNPDTDKWEIEVLINGEWEQITNLDITIQ